MSVTFVGQPATKSSWLAQINGSGHKQALQVYTFVVIAHWLEHLVQVFQIYTLGWPVPEARGVLGLWFPVLVHSEVLHFGYALFMLVGLIALLPGFAGRSRFFWKLSLALQVWHFFEHFLLQMQWITGVYLLGAAKPTSIVQLWIPRVELHFFYNLVVFIPMVIAMYYHLYPPAWETAHTRCSCSRRACALPTAA